MAISSAGLHLALGASALLVACSTLDSEAGSADCVGEDAGCLGTDPSTCEQLDRDECLTRSNCVLEYLSDSGPEDSRYACRAAIGQCEGIHDEEECSASTDCTWDPGSCYCPSGLNCYCTGGPPPVCREADGDDVDCSSLARDDCLASENCFLDFWGYGYGPYECREAISDCERWKDEESCSAGGNCHWDPGDCYCPEDLECYCGGGPAPSCRLYCGGLAGYECPEGYYCSLPVYGDGWPGTGAEQCTGNADQMGVCLLVPDDCDDFEAPLCGCADDLQATTYTNECVRRQARASFSHVGACE